MTTKTKTYTEADMFTWDENTEWHFMYFLATIYGADVPEDFVVPHKDAVKLLPKFTKFMKKLAAKGAI